MTVPCALVLSIMLGPLYVHFVHYEADFLPALGGSSYQDMAFSHHYQGRIDFNTVNLFQSTGMD